jgi:hypothetical protein
MLVEVEGMYCSVNWWVVVAVYAVVAGSEAVHH